MGPFLLYISSLTRIVFGGSDRGLLSQTADRRKYSISATRMLRLMAATLVAVSFVIIQFINIPEVGSFAQISDGKAVVLAGSHPGIVIWDVVAILLFITLMLRNANSTIMGVPSRARRIASFAIDFWFSLLILSSIEALAPLALEAARTGHFVWHFQRAYTVGTDAAYALPGVLITMTLMIFYFAFPLTRGEQTVGCFIVRIKTTPPFGDSGRFTFRAALRRTFYEFRGLASIISRDWKRDTSGRTWYDIETNCTVVLIADD